MIPLTMDNLLMWIAVILVGVLGTGRIVRLVTYDDYPPTIAIRAGWARLVNDSGWSKLASCLWCFAPWAAIPCGLWFWLGYGTWVEAAWWIFYGWMAFGYVISMVVARDEPPHTAP